MDKPKTIPDIGADTIFLLERLRQTPAGAVVSYADLSEVVGYDIRERRHRLATAVRKARNDHGLVFSAVHGVGLRRDTDPEIIVSSVAARRRIRKAARVHLKKLSVVEFAALEAADKVRHCAEASLFAATVHAASEATARKIAGRMADTPQVLPVAKSLEAMK